MSLRPTMMSSAVAAAYKITNSLRFDSARSTFAYRVIGIATNNKIATIHLRVKKVRNAGTTQVIYGAYDGSSAEELRIISDGGSSGIVDTIQWTNTSGGQVTSLPMMRDVTGHYDIVLALDTTQSVASSRARMYVNKAEVSYGSSSYPAQNSALMCQTSGNREQIGARWISGSASLYLDGYVSDFHKIDGLALGPTSFNDSNGAIAYVGAYGAQGSRLFYNDGTSLTTLGTDSSGKGNNWTLSNFTLSGVNAAQSNDTPTNNFCTLNSLDKHAYVSVTNGALTCAGNTGTDSGVVSGTLGFNSGQIYFETTITAVGGLSYGMVAFSSVQNESNADSVTTTAYAGYRNAGTLVGVTRTTPSIATTFTTGDILGCAIDLTNGAIYWSKNKVWVNGGVPTSGASRTGATHTWTPDGRWAFPSAAGYSGSVSNLNCGQLPLNDTPPTGYKTPCAANITNTAVTTSGIFTGNVSADGRYVPLNGTPTTMTINGNAVTWGTHADKLANGFKVRTSSASYNASGSNSYSVTTTGTPFKTATAQVNP